MNYLKLFLIFTILLNEALVAADRELVLLHTNDIHAHVLGVRADDSMCNLTDMNTPQCFGGFDRLATAVAAMRATSPNVLVLDAGDQFQGSLFHLLYKGLASADFMNQIGYDAMTVGNHEFDEGPKAFARFIDVLKFPVVSANIDVSKSHELKQKIAPYTIILRNGMKIGVIGYTTEDTAYLSSPGRDIKFLPIIASVKKAVRELKAKKVDVIVAVSHSGLNRDIEVAKNVEGIAAIVCGHSNSLLSNLVENADGPSPLVVLSPAKKPVLLVSAYAYTKYLGKLKFAFDAHGVPTSWTGEPILLDHKIKREPKMERQIKELYEPIKNIEAKTVGFAPFYLEGQTCRFQECVFGNLITDAMLDFGRQFGTVIALMNGGGIRASVPVGPISQAQLREVLPLDKTLVFLKLKGDVIGEIIEHGTAFADDKKNDNTGRFLQVAGLKYKFDTKKPRGQRVYEIKTIDPLTKKEEALDKNKIYAVVTNSYLANGGDNYRYFEKSLERWNVSFELKDLVANFLAIKKAELPKLEGRIMNEQPIYKNKSSAKLGNN